MNPTHRLPKRLLVALSVVMFLISDGILYANHKTHIAWFPDYSPVIECPNDHTPYLWFTVKVAGDNMIDLPEGTEPGERFNNLTDITANDIVALNPDLDMRLHVFFRRDTTKDTFDINFVGHANVELPYSIKLHENAAGQQFQTIAYQFRYFGLSRVRLFTAWPGWALAGDVSAGVTQLRKVACRPVARQFIYQYPTVADHQEQRH
jgi:hypothetical protein